MLKFESKARTLEKLRRNEFCGADILDSIIYLASDFNVEDDGIFKEVCCKFKEKKVIVRSSSHSEDTRESSEAGKFVSIPSVDSSNIKELYDAIDKVIKSYGEFDTKDEFFIQEMLEDTCFSGVVFSSDIESNAPYYVVNYHEGNDCSVVTSGTGENINNFLVYREYPFKQLTDLRIRKVVECCKSLEIIFENESLDVEFAINEKGILFLLQVRPLAVKKINSMSQLFYSKNLNKLSKKVEKLSAPHPNLHGTKSVFGIMSDWNPVEMIGNRPKKLAITLYKELITDSIWAEQRRNYGYKDLRSFPLMHSFLGIPYIDLRASFNSFIPTGVDSKLTNKLVDYYIKKLVSDPKLHDKVEFEIVFSCNYLDLGKKIKTLTQEGFSEKEIEDLTLELKNITNEIINLESGKFVEDLKKITILEQKKDQILNSKMALIDKIYWLVETCKSYGTLPFAGIARSAFIATQMLHSMIREKIFSEDDFACFMSSLSTITREMGKDLFLLSKSKISKNMFLDKYGHLRPGTYDITSLSYKENFDVFFSNICEQVREYHEIEFLVSKKQERSLKGILAVNGIECSAADLLRFIKQAIVNREFAKFQFTKLVSVILDLVIEYGERLDISREDLAFLDIRKVLNLYAELEVYDISDLFKKNIDENKDLYKFTKVIRLPNLITKTEDIFAFRADESEGTFVTLKRVQGEMAKIDKDLEGKIVLIDSADPGYDWIFSKDIKGLITKYGGANSHMTIRCAEFQLTAAIGVGEKLFNILEKTNFVEIDAHDKKIRIIS